MGRDRLDLTQEMVLDPYTYNTTYFLTPTRWRGGGCDMEMVMVRLWGNARDGAGRHAPPP
jgi:hypothetical protein